MQTENENDLKYLGFRFKLKVCNKITVDVYSKPTKSYVHLKTCYPRRNINKKLDGIALRLRRFYDSDEKYEKRANEYQNYIIPRN